jgi:DNA methyltransferase 1-associated protein 1
MAAADVRDMLDLPADGHPRPHKKQKIVEKRPGKLVWN